MQMMTVFQYAVEVTFGDTIPDAPEIFCEIPLPVYKKHSIASECRDIMNQIKTLTYTVTSESALPNLQYHLKKALNILRKESKRDHGLMLNQREKHKDLQKKVAQNNYETKFESLPVPRKQKSNLTGRVDAANDPNKTAQNISVAAKKQIPQKMFEEIITIVDESDMNSAVPTNTTNQSTYISLPSEYCREE